MFSGKWVWFVGKMSLVCWKNDFCLMEIWVLFGGKKSFVYLKNEFSLMEKWVLLSGKKEFSLVEKWVLLNGKITFVGWKNEFCLVEKKSFVWWKNVFCLLFHQPASRPATRAVAPVPPSPPQCHLTSWRLWPCTSVVPTPWTASVEKTLHNPVSYHKPRLSGSGGTQMGQIRYIFHIRFKYILAHRARCDQTDSLLGQIRATSSISDVITLRQNVLKFDLNKYQFCPI